jgi:polyisoprenoid-binding protein YceI
MKNNAKKISLVLVILLILSILLFVIIKEKKDSKNNYTQQEEIMETKENLKGSGIYSFDAISSKINWEGSKTLIKEWIDTGNISLQSGYLTLENNEIKEGKIVIDMNSISAEKTGGGGGEDNLSKHLKSEDFFNTENFPTSEFSLTSLTKTEGEYEYIAKGDITIKNITKTIEFPIKIYMIGESIFVNGEIILDRSLFEVKFGSTSFFKDIGDKAINNNFKLKLELVGKK